jgi:hypothetical protein
MLRGSAQVLFVVFFVFFWGAGGGVLQAKRKPCFTSACAFGSAGETMTVGERTFLTTLVKTRKPVLLCFSKADLLNSDVEQVRNERCAELIVDLSDERDRQPLRQLVERARFFCFQTDPSAGHPFALYVCVCVIGCIVLTPSYSSRCTLAVDSEAFWR